MSRTDWDAYSTFYLEEAWDYFADLPALGWGMPLGLSVLEVGVGNGRIANLFAPRARRYVGIDISHGMLGLMPIECARHMDIVQGDFMHFACNEVFDRVLMPYRVLHYLTPWEQALEKGWSFLAPGGMLFIDIQLGAKKEEWIGPLDKKILRIRQVIAEREISVCLESIGFKLVHATKSMNILTMWLEKPRLSPIDA